jgi:rhodanese-related sulfurtransferase
MDLKLKTIKECLLLVVMSMGCAFLFNAFNPGGIALVGQWDTSKGVVSAVTRQNPVVHDIEIDDIHIAKALHDGGEAVFIDARPLDIYAEGHIRGAEPLPLESVEIRVESFLAKYPFSTHPVTYCSGRECEDSHMLAQLLMDIGYSNI